MKITFDAFTPPVSKMLALPLNEKSLSTLITKMSFVEPLKIRELLPESFKAPFTRITLRPPLPFKIWLFVIDESCTPERNCAKSFDIFSARVSTSRPDEKMPPRTAAFPESL